MSTIATLPLVTASLILGHELGMQLALGAALIVTKGYAALEVGHAYTRARELCHQVGDTAHLCPVLYGLWGFITSGGRC
jgi:predicted ATPase